MKKATIIQLFLVLFLHPYASAKNSTNEKEHILCLNTYTDAFSWSNRVINLLTEYTQEDPDISLSVVYMRSLMLNSNESLAAVKEHLTESSQELTPKAIVILGGTALTLKDKIKEIWGEVPILYLSSFNYIGNLDAYINNRAIEEEEKIYISELQDQFNLTFIHTPLFIKENVDLLRSLYPNVAEIVLVKDQLQVNYDIENELQQVLQTNYPTISLRSITPDSLSTYDLIEHLNGLDPHRTAILFSSWSYIRNNVDGTSISTNSRELIGTCKNPIFTLNISDITTYSGRMTGGYTYSANELKESVFRMLTELMHPEPDQKRASYSLTTGNPYILYDRAERRGMDLSLLPSTTVFLNKPSSFFENNRIAISLFVLLLVVALLFLLFRLRLLKVNQNALMGKQEILYQFKRQFNNMSICYAEYKLLYEDGVVVDYIYLFLNKACKDYQMDHEQVANRKASEVLPPDTFAHIIQTLNSLVETGDTQTSLMYWPLTNSWLYSEFSLSSKKDHVDRYLVDQTELVLLKEKAEKSNKEIIDANKKSELILKNANSLLAYVDTDYKVLWSNADYAFNGRAKGLCLVGNKRLCSMLEVGYACELCPIKATIANQEITSREFTREGIGEFRVTATPLTGTDVAKEGVILKIDDITEYKRLIRDLERSTTRAEEADKLKSAFLANMSHEIRTPLNAIIGFSELLQTTDCKEEREEYMNIINTNNELLLRLIGDILDLSKIESGSVELLPERFDFSTFFEETKAMLGPRFQKSEVELLSINPLAKCVVELDKSRCLQILTNYLTNAFKYTKQGTVTMSYCYTDNCIIIKVEDTGIGIPEEKIGRLFDRFEKLDDFAQGTGLGLSICKALADSIGATVGAESIEGVGSTFWVSIPCKAEIEISVDSFQAELSVNDQTKLPREYNGTQLRNILIAEDNDSNYLLAKAILKDYSVTRAVNGVEAVRLAKQYKFDAILMDMKMPMMGGLEATKKIRLFDPHIIIVAVTANAYDSDRQNALEAGCNSFIAKPIRRSSLLASILEN